MLKPAIKFIKYNEISFVDLTHMKINNENLSLVSSYLKTNPNLKKLYLNENDFTDEGFEGFIESLESNTNLIYLSIQRC